jgi:3-phenylpropionate/trans-cinnamate dioxygenase ferredoxin reductase subunit
METYEYLIVGGGLAGQRAGVGIRKVDTEGSVALIADEPHIPYQRPPLSKGYLRGEEGLDKVHLQEADYYAQSGIEVINGVRAQAIDPGAQNVTLADGRTVGYGKLLLATGGRARRLPVPGSDLLGVYTLRTIEDADSIRGAAQVGVRALVVGGGFVGAEVAASLAQLDVDVTMILMESRPLEMVVPPQLGTLIEAMYQAHGVRVLPGAMLERLQGDGKVERAVVRLGDETQLLDTDMTVMGVGIRLNTELARDAGLKMAQDGGVVVDAHLRTSEPAIYAAGDIAAWPDPTSGKQLRVEHWDVARRQGLLAGRNMAGEEKPYAALPYFFSDLFDLSFEVWGDLTSWDETVLRGSPDEGAFAFYYFHHGSLVGVLAAGRPDEERKPMQALVQGRKAYADVADALTDEATDLEDLVES